MKRAEYIRQNTGNSFVKAMTDSELAEFVTEFEKECRNNTVAEEENYNWLQEDI